MQKHTIRDIETLDCNEKFRRTNFGPTEYSDIQNKQKQGFEIIKDALTLLVQSLSWSSFQYRQIWRYQNQQSVKNYKDEKIK
jgi:phage regulator Rha-like protein